MSIRKKIVTDLSVSLEGMTKERMKALLESAVTDSWVNPFIDIVLEDFEALSYGMGGPGRYTVRDLAVHAHNRFAYYDTRCKATSGNVHQFMDQLLSHNVPMERTMPATVRVKVEGTPYSIYEVLGQFNFDAHVLNVPELAAAWRRYGWIIQPTYE